MRSKAAGSSIGLPHSGHSPGVSGRLSSSIVLRTSTNGTSATTAPHSPGFVLAATPTSPAPPAPPRGFGLGGAAARAPPRRSALDRDPAGRGEAGGDQPLGRVDEIVERVP